MPSLTSRTFLPVLLLALLLATVTGCGDDLSSGAPDAQVVPAVDAGSPPTVVFLNFEGAALTQSFADGIIGDSRHGTCPYLVADVTVAPWRQSDPARDTFIDTVVANVKAMLAPWNFDIVTTRPTSGDYMMVLFGGQGSIVGFSDQNYGTVELDCGNAYPDDIGFVFEYSDTPTIATNSAIFTILQGVGGYPTSDDNSCLCADGSCTTGHDNTAPCVLLHDAHTVAYSCSPAGGTQDEYQLLDDQVGLR